MLEAREFFEITYADARTHLRQSSTEVAAWREALRATGVTGALAKRYEPAFVHDKAGIVIRLWQTMQLNWPYLTFYNLVAMCCESARQL